MIVVSYADDSVVGFEHRQDILTFLADLRTRMAKFGLQLNEGIHPAWTTVLVSYH